MTYIGIRTIVRRYEMIHDTTMKRCTREKQCIGTEFRCGALRLTDSKLITWNQLTPKLKSFYEKRN